MRAQFFLTCTLLLSANPALSETAQAKLELPPIADVQRLHLDNLLGSIEVRGSEESVVRIEAEVLAVAKTADDARALAQAIRIEQIPDASRTLVRVTYPTDRHTSFRQPRSEKSGVVSKWLAPLVRRTTISTDYGGRTVEVGPSKGAASVAVHVTVHLPFDIESSFRQVLGRIQGTALRGAMALEIVEGEIVAQQFYGRLQVRTGGGDVRVTSYHGEELDVHTGSGKIELIGVHADAARLLSASGAIRASGITGGTFRAESNTGKVELHDLEPQAFELITGSSNVDLATRLKHARRAEITTGTGDVTLRVGKRAYFDLRARTGSGQVKAKGISLDAIDGDPGESRVQRGGGGVVAMRIEAPAGQVTVRPYDASWLDLLVQPSQ